MNNDDWLSQLSKRGYYRASWRIMATVSRRGGRPRHCYMSKQTLEFTQQLECPHLLEAVSDIRQRVYASSLCLWTPIHHARACKRPVRTSS